MAVAVFGTAWIVVCLIGYLAFGRTLDNDTAMYWYGLGWILAGVVALAPFAIYGISGVEE